MKMARRHNKEGENYLKQEGKRQKAMEDIDGGLHPAVDGQSLYTDTDTVDLLTRTHELHCIGALSLCCVSSRALV